jgi:hypothetical protein
VHARSHSWMLSSKRNSYSINYSRNIEDLWRRYSPPSSYVLAFFLSQVLPYFQRHCIYNNPLCFFVKEGFRLSDARYEWTWWIREFMWFRPLNVTPYAYEGSCCIAQAWACQCVCLSGCERVWESIKEPPIKPLLVRSFYSSRSSSYIEIQCPTCDFDAVEILYTI